MQLQNALKKMNKVGEVKKDEYGQYSVINNGRVLSIGCNPPHNTPKTDVVSINVRRVNDVSDSMTDYFAGSYFNTLSQAIRFMEG
jgi:hypothetical protein